MKSGKGAGPRGRKREVGRGEETPLVAAAIQDVACGAAARSQEHALQPLGLPSSRRHAPQPLPGDGCPGTKRQAASMGKMLRPHFAVKGRQPRSLQSGGGARVGTAAGGHRGAEAMGRCDSLGN